MKAPDDGRNRPDPSPAIERFLALLKAGPANPGAVFNPWRDWDDRDAPPRKLAPAKRRENLAAYLQARARSARFILVGEAPSHRGGRFTGIPFCSEVELTRKRDLVAHRALAPTSVDAAVKPMRERSAAVVWGELERYGCAYQVVLWNAFPWHPHVAAGAGRSGPATNRRPRPAEVEEGRAPLAALLECFAHPVEVFAVGRVAELALAQWPEARCAGWLRHPAQGGERKFREHFRQLVAARMAARTRADRRS